MESQKKEITKRCFWVNMKNPLYVKYHDREWGVPEHSDKKLFEMLFLEWFQAGLSWECVLNKREAFRQAFDQFNAEKISGFDDEKCEELLSNPIIRNRLKIKASITNSRVFLDIQKEFGSFDAYIWGFTKGKTVLESCDIRTTSPLSDEISKDLKKRGMKFVGSTIIYSYLQAIGIINAHVKKCDCYSLCLERGGEKMDEKEKTREQKQNDKIAQDEEKIRDMKQELEDYMEEQGIYIRQ